jgi:aldehyde dehydrogenase (NAD+)
MPTGMESVYNNIYSAQREFYNSGITRNINSRLKTLRNFRTAIKSNANDLITAIGKDNGKHEFESFSCELFCVLEELNLVIRKLKSWSARKHEKTPVFLYRTRSQVVYEPYGIVLIIGTWNFPLIVTLVPLIAAIAAGNCVVLKPSEYNPETNRVLKRIIDSVFPKELCFLVEGEVETTKALLKLQFDYMVFTGSSEVGKIIAQQAAVNLTPVLLELGGKNPCIIHKDANLKTAAARIAYGKFLNAGQNCCAPDHLLVHEEVKSEFFKLLMDEFDAMLGKSNISSQDYGRIISKNHYNRLTRMLSDGEILYGGVTNESELKIQPTIIENIAETSDLMNKEIFGPLLPVFSFKTIDEVIKRINRTEKPLAIYIFSNNRKDYRKLAGLTSSGAVSINAVSLHASNFHIPFGGVGNSGNGKYHGKWGIETLSHKKTIIKKYNFPESRFLYPPYGNKIKLLKFFGSFR